MTQILLMAIGLISSSFVSAQNANDLAIVTGQAPAICTKIVEFGACSTQAATDQAMCNGEVKSVPDFKYWQCVCNAQMSMLACYQLCPDDAQMQLQFRTNQASAQNTCKYVDEVKRAGGDTDAEVEEEETQVGNDTVTIIKPKRNATKTGSPKPTNTPIDGDYSNGSDLIKTGVFTLILAALAAFV